MASLSSRSGVRSAEAATRRGRRVTSVDVLAVGAAAALTLALVLPWYTRRPYWFDELVSLEIAGLGPRSFIEYVATVEANMALYHGLLGVWTVVGEDVWSVRALSIAVALATLPFLYGLAVRLFDRRTAVIATLLLSVNVSFVGHARDARGYALATLLVTASSYWLVRAVEGSRRRDWALYGAAAALAVWTHVIAGLVIGAQVAWLLLERRVVPLRRTLLAAAGIGLLVLPLAVAIVASGQGGQIDWLERPGLAKLPGLLEWYVESWATFAVYAVGGAAAIGGAVAEWRRREPSEPRGSLLLLLWLGLPAPAAFLVSYVEPVYLYRYFLVCLPALVLLVAAGLTGIRPGWLGPALAAVALALSVRTVVSCQPDCKIRHDDWRSAAAYVQARARPGDAILFFPEEVRTPLAHYLGADRPRLLFPERWRLTGGADEGSTTLEAAAHEADRHDRVWLISWWLPSEEARAALSRTASLVSKREFAGNVSVELYDPGER